MRLLRCARNDDPISLKHVFRTDGSFGARHLSRDSRKEQAQRVYRKVDRPVIVSNEMPKNRLVSLTALALFAGLILFHLSTIFQTTPFLQQEMMGQAQLYGLDSRPFLTRIFDQLRTDAGLGRFRFVEYLTEAAYWKAATLGALPKDLYDYFSISLHLLLAGLLYALFRKRGIENVPAVFFSCLFLFGLSGFMIAVWHYRKAKVWVSLWFLLLFFLKPDKNRSHFWLYALVVFLGFITDPQFVLVALAIYVVASMGKNRAALKAAVLGNTFGVLVVLLLNGLVAPQFNSTATLLPYGTPTLGTVHFSPAGILNFPILVGNLVGVLHQKYTYAVGISIYLLLLASCLWHWKKDRPQNLNWGLVFLGAVPLSSFVINPGAEWGVYATYYGHCLFLLWVLALANTWQVGSIPIKTGILVITIACAFFNFTNRQALYGFWVERHFDRHSPQAVQKYWKDYALMQNLAHGVAEVKIDYPVQGESAVLGTLINSEGMFLNAITDGQGKLPHSGLRYLVLPVLFQKEIKEHKIALLKNYQSTQSP